MWISGIGASGPYACLAISRIACPHRSTTSLATHLRKTSPMNSDSESLAPGENQGAWKVSVRARCCSAITRREMRCRGEISYGPGHSRASQKRIVLVAYRSQDGVHEFVQFVVIHQAAALQNAHAELRDHRQVGSKHFADRVAEPVIVLESLNLGYLTEGVESSVV